MMYAGLRESIGDARNQLKLAAAAIIFLSKTVGSRRCLIGFKPAYRDGVAF